MNEPVTVSYTHLDVYKRQGKQYATFDREYLWGIFSLWATHDNAVDEGWWGLYDIPFLANTTQADYDSSALIRYWCRPVSYTHLQSNMALIQVI